MCSSWGSSYFGLTPEDLETGSPMSVPVSQPTIRVAAAVVERELCYLITQRRPSAVLPLLWEFPGGRVELGESDADALKRELRFRLGVEVEPGRLMSFVTHAYERYTVELYLYECELGQGTPQELNVNAYRWVKSTDFEKYPFTPADEASMTQLLGL